MRNFLRHRRRRRSLHISTHWCGGTAARQSLVTLIGGCHELTKESGTWWEGSNGQPFGGIGTTVDIHIASVHLILKTDLDTFCTSLSVRSFDLGGTARERNRYEQISICSDHRTTSLHAQQAKPVRAYASANMALPDGNTFRSCMCAGLATLIE